MTARRYLRIGWMIDGTGGPIRRNLLLRLDGGQISAIEDDRPGDRPDAAITGDFSRCTILPPLVDAHIHLFMSPTSDRQRRKWQLAADYRQLLPQMSGHAEDLWRHGVLAARDGGDRGGYALDFRNSRTMPQALTLKAAGRGWHREGRYGRLIGRSPQPRQSLAEAVGGEEMAVDQVKIVNSGYNSLKIFGQETRPQFTVDELTAAVAVAGRHGRPVMVHANGREPVRIALEAGCRSIEHGFFMGRDNLERMAERGTFWVPTACTMQAFLDHLDALGDDADPRVIAANLEQQLEQLALARHLGVRVAIGTDAGSLGVYHGPSLAEEMRLFLAAGYSLAETVACATANGAELLGIGDFGVLKKGAAATFLVIPGEPAELPNALSLLREIFLSGQSTALP